MRGHLYPLITRRCLEHDFGAEAVYPDTISYRTEGWHMRRANRVLFIICLALMELLLLLSLTMKNKKIASLHPDLIIVSFGTNEAHSRRYLAQAHKMQIGRLLGMLKAACPEAFFYLLHLPEHMWDVVVHVLLIREP